MYMPLKLAWIRLATAVSAGVMACAFAHFYSFVSSMTVQHGVALPFITYFVLHCSPFAYTGPAILLFLGAYFLRRHDSGTFAFECTVSVTWMLTLFWALFAILAWQLPQIEIREYIR
jgi:hypothetical protein